jgi:lactoylglutathione lyase
MAKLEHIGINIEDIEKSLTFYDDLFGFKEIERFTSGEAKISMIDIGGGILELVQRPGSPVIAHVAFHDPKFDETLAKLEAKGITIRLVTMDNGGRICFFSDPDGYIVEIMEKGE